MKSIAHIFLTVGLLLLLITGCKHGQLENVPDWTAFHKYYNDKDYQEYLQKNINSLSDDELMFSSIVKSFYSDNGSAIWTANGLQEHLTKQFLELYAKSEEHGLSPEIFGYQIINNDIRKIQNNEVGSSEELYRLLAEIEVQLTRANVLYAKTMKYGATDPKEVNGGKWKYAMDSLRTDFVTDALKASCEGTHYLMSLHPTDSVYLALQGEMRKFLALREQTWDSIPAFSADSGHCVKNVSRIGKRLLQLEEITSTYVPSDTLGRVLMPAINRFRENRGIPTSRHLDEETFTALNKKPQEYIDQLAANLERCRWQTKHKKGSDFVAVNIPDFMLEARSADTVALRMKICCGRSVNRKNEDSCRVNGILPAAKTESPLLYSEIYSIVLNPEWKVPYSIIKDEYYYKMTRNAMGVTNKEKLYFVDGRTKKQVRAESIDWKKVSQNNIPYQIIQTSGKHNALGLYKFNISNSESVYLHSTNNPGAFRRRVRAVSHGCIRVCEPDSLAKLILTMNDYDTTRWEQVMITVGQEPWTEEGTEYLEKMQEKEEEYRLGLTGDDSLFYRPLRPTNLGLRKRMPVFIEYYTVFIGANGDVNYRNDVYHKDKNILNAIDALKPKTTSHAKK